MRHYPEKTLGRVLNDTDTSRTGSATVTSIVYHGKVINIEDNLNSKRVQVRIVGIDDGVSDENLPWAISSMPNFFFCLPQIGEHVLVFMMNPWNKRFTRVWMGPIQTENFLEQTYKDSMTKFGFVVLDEE